MLLSLSNQQPQIESQVACCPSCQKRSRFQFAGEQRWPQRVAQAAGIEPVVRLWNCDRCHTTISENDLKQ